VRTSSGSFRCQDAQPRGAGRVLDASCRSRAQLIGRRPLTLVRHMGARRTSTKARFLEIPASVHQLWFEEAEGGEGTRVWVDDLAGLLGLVERTSYQRNLPPPRASV